MNEITEAAPPEILQIDPIEPQPGEATYRDRLLSSLILVGLVGLALALPFALQAGAEFFLPLATAIVVGLALSPLADWLSARGIPNSVSAVLSLLFMVLLIVLTATAVLQPAIDLVDALPQFLARLTDRLRILMASLGSFPGVLDAFGGEAQRGGGEAAGRLRAALEEVLLGTPHVLLQTLLTLMLAYFLLEARIRVRRQILLDRSDFASSVRAARVFRDVQAQMAAYFATTTMVAAGVGVIVGSTAWLLGWERPVMWGGLAAFLNLLPYIGPLSMVMLVGLFGLSGEGSLFWSLLPALAYLGLHTVEANVVTPMLMGRRLSVSPAAILVSLLFFGWVWGIVGLFLAVPILLIFSSVLEHMGRPNVIGFLFGEPLFHGVEVQDTLQIDNG